MRYTMRQIAEKFDMRESTLRYYTDLGILPCTRDAGNRRVFNDDSVSWLRAIRCLRACGMPMEAIGRYCDLCTREENSENLQERFHIILEQRENAHRRLKEATAVAAFMDRKVQHYQDILAGKIPDDSNPGKWTPGKEPRCKQPRQKQTVNP